jgi:hypothetical protein
MAMRPVDKAEQDAALAVLERHRERLLEITGAHYVDVGYKYVDGRPTDQLAIRVHVERKRPEAEVAPEHLAPTEVEGLPVDVLQTNPEPQQSRDARFDPLVGGIATTNSTSLAGFVGTLGAVVFDRPTGAAMALSNRHVYVGTGQAGDNISQPSSTNPNDVVGTLTRWDLGLDCAVATLNGTRGRSTSIESLSTGVVALFDPVIGSEVTKSGRTTGVTSGVIDGVSATEFTIVPDPARPAPGGEISAGGDSGSIWVLTGNHDAGIGLHFAGETSTDPADERAWAKRLINVARALDIRFRALPAQPVALGDDMQPGEALNPGQSVASTDGRFVFVYQTDGNLVLYGPGGPLWASNTAGQPAGVCVMQTDGNLVVYDPDRPLWSSDTWQHPGSRLVVQNDGNVVIYTPAGQAVWSTNTFVPTGPQATGDDMQPGEVLNPGQAIASADGRYSFVYQTDGNLVLYRGGAPLWASNTAGTPAGVCIMQADGNLVIYGPGGAPLWSSDTWHDPGSRLVVQNDGNVVIYTPAGQAIWSTDTWVPTGPTAGGDDMQPGEVLRPGDSLWSASARYLFVYQDDGNLVLYGRGGALWASNTAGSMAGACVMQGDGNLVVYAPGGHPLWSSDTWQHPGSRLVVQDDGNVVVYTPAGQAVWATNTWVPTGPTAAGDDMVAGEVLTPGDAVSSADGRFVFVYQTDGNLVLYDPGGPRWASNTAGSMAGVCVMQGDGNLVVYGPGGAPLWSSDTWHDPGSRLVVQNDGNVVIYAPGGTPIWATNTPEAAPQGAEIDLTSDGQPGEVERLRAQIAELERTNKVLRSAAAFGQETTPTRG